MVLDITVDAGGQHGYKLSEYIVRSGNRWSDGSNELPCQPRVCSARERERGAGEGERETAIEKQQQRETERERGGAASLPPPPPGVHSSYVGLGQQQLGKTNEEGNDECRGSK